MWRDVRARLNFARTRPLEEHPFRRSGPRPERGASLVCDRPLTAKRTNSFGTTDAMRCRSAPPPEWKTKKNSQISFRRPATAVPADGSCVSSERLRAECLLKHYETVRHLKPAAKQNTNSSRSGSGRVPGGRAAV
ncbi:hypothetical protein EVAR_88375_1 [Eumeta japonica]|uniref:Uncharacterized protein n=1 Tax=Eumeta variegata TaxID=151549 RepID=A0A4C1XB85_EUMVA|nr:hypothetical protein EVAR_88375_1 [Eumeta japonica]